MYRNNNSLESVIALFSGYSREELAATIRNRGGEESGSCTESCEFISAEDITEETTEGQGEQIVVEARSCFGGSNTPTPLRNLWKTPPEIFAALNAEFIFQLDAAASAYNALCHKFITAEQNTLITPWSDYLSTGYVWLNPPYSNIAPFIRKAAEENKNHQIGTVALLPADTSVGWFREAIQTASEVRFITGGRLSFINPETGKPVNGNNKGSLLVIWHPYPRTHCRFTTVERDELLNFGKKFLSRLGAA
ncbi:phage N-6-adenine-methyltransferase [Enterobacteriaceae bacterium ESL0689]|nr:phage N-6-adenine-methyltransferase [Enterobacteriaceae bacterium ESL0689]